MTHTYRAGAVRQHYKDDSGINALLNPWTDAHDDEDDCDDPGGVEENGSISASDMFGDYYLPFSQHQLQHVAGGSDTTELGPFDSEAVHAKSFTSSPIISTTLAASISSVIVDEFDALRPLTSPQRLTQVLQDFWMCAHIHSHSKHTHLESLKLHMQAYDSICVHWFGKLNAYICHGGMKAQQYL
jgi:hypothetical protein